MKSTFRRAVAATLLGSMLFVAACGSDDPSDDASGTPTATATANPSETPTEQPTIPTQSGTPLTSLDQITVSDAAFGTLPSVEADWPLVTDTTVVKTLIQGSGPAVNAQLEFSFYYVGINARTGITFDSNYESIPFLMSATGSLIEGFTKSVTGVSAGSRVLIAITSADGYATGNTSAGIEIGDTIVFVVDIVAAAYNQATGDTVADGNAYASVSGTDGIPAIRPVTGAAAPAETVATTLTAGASPYTVSTDAVIVVRYTGIEAASGRVLETNYSAENPDYAILDRLIPGFVKGLEGVNVGSRVLLTIPAAEAYPNGSDAFDPPLVAGQTLIYVVDILWAMPVQ
ncbi:MAG: FKBP-type peptidyl-prolyl cis-trans isomerase [Propionibacteriaceae bacterium]|jgi:peptidylprolyl isomerase|nr:FKBP-type peptidyl-prolyl cis-trans isomerase [Propionibacteriaceae bacterium]